MQFFIDEYDGLKVAVTKLCEYLVDNGASQDATFNCRLAVTELVGNVLKHGDAKATLSIEIDEESILLTVSSSQVFKPPKISRCSNVYAEHGRGLFLVDCISTERTFTREGAITVRIKK